MLQKRGLVYLFSSLVRAACMLLYVYGTAIHTSPSMLHWTTSDLSMQVSIICYRHAAWQLFLLTACNQPNIVYMLSFAFVWAVLPAACEHASLFRKTPADGIQTCLWILTADYKVVVLPTRAPFTLSLCRLSNCQRSGIAKLFTST